MISEEDIKFHSGATRLAGTLKLPATHGEFPGVVLVSGSGQVDRNENAKKLPIDALEQIAKHLAEHGIATLRYDKRGVGASEGEFWETGFYDNVADAKAAIHYMRAHEYIQTHQVFVLGHSEGAVIASRLAATDQELAGAILLAGTAQSGEDVLLWQSRQVIKGMHGLNGFLIHALHLDVQKAQRKQLDKIKKTSRDWVRFQLIAKLNAKWYREFMAYNPAEDMPKISIPILAITGSKDIQVNPADLEKMSTLINSEFESHEIPDLTHMLRTDPNEPTLSAYRELVQHPVDAQVLDIITNWLQRHTLNPSSIPVISERV
jgi:uncharacterized protein